MPAPTPPAAARIVFRVGVTGHRDIGPDGEAALRRVTRAVLRSVAAAVEQVRGEEWPGYSADPPVVRVVSSLAAGSDTVVAGVAAELAEAHPGRFELHAPIPFLLEDYEKDFHLPDRSPDVPALAEFRRLVEACKGRVFELGCDHSTREGRMAGYEAAGRVVLQQCDLLLVVQSPTAPHRQGSTSQINREANDFQLPAIVLDPAKIVSPAVRDRKVVFHQKGFMGRRPSVELDLLDGAGVPREEFPDVTSAVAVALRPPADDEAHGRAAETGIGTYFADRTGWLLSAVYSLPWRVLVRWVGRLFRPSTWSAVGRWLATPFGSGRDEPPEPKLPPELTALGAAYDTNYRHAHALGVQYTTRYRGAFMWNYLLGAAAVTCGLLTAADKAWHGGWAKVELALVVLMLVNYLLARERRWQARSIHYRVLAEHFRHMRFLFPLGLVPPDSRHPVYRVSGEPRKTWMSWYFLAVVRAVGLVKGRLTPPLLANIRDVVRVRWLDRQIAYKASVASRNTGVSRFLESFMWAFLFGTLAACVVHLFHPADAWLPILTLFAAGLPAWGAAFHAIATQAEFERLKHHTEETRQTLEAIRKRFDDLGERITFPELIELAQEISEVLLMDVDEWQVVNELVATRPI